ncbi:hypothetical protein P7C70_g5371, partial [Phenoliferia sp. Uapishka_3]
MSSLLSHKSIRIKKPTHGHQADKKTGEIGPVDVLIDRSQQWKHVTKSLLHYYKGLSAIETSSAKATLALTETIQVPFHEGHMFLGEGGWQEVLYEVRDNTKILSDYHTQFAQKLDETVVRELETVRTHIKEHIALIEKEAGVLAHEVAKERTTSASHLTALQSGIDVYETSAQHMMAKDDPYITHQYTSTQLTNQVHKENDLQAALIRFQQQQPAYESGIVQSIQTACKNYDEARAIQQAEIEKVQHTVAAALQRISPSAEYEYYASHEGAVLDPNTPFRSADAITFPGQNHASTIPIKEGILERKKRFTKSYKEAHYVLTASGYLHERRSTDDVNAATPTFSLFLPECSLGQPASPNDKSHKFHVEGNKAIKSSFEGKMKTSLRFGGKEIAYSFRARTHTEMLGWWGEMDKLSRDTKASSVKSSGPVKSGPIANAVANIGYAEPESAHTVTHEPVAVNDPNQVALPGTTATTTHATAVPVSEERQGEHEDPSEYSDDESGGSSAEEEELARTAPSTPAAYVVHESSPLDNAGALHNSEHEVTTTSTSDAGESLPTYTGNGTSTAEKEGLVEKGKPGFLAGIFGSHDTTASTSSPQE